MTDYPRFQVMRRTTGHSGYDYHGARQVNLMLRLVEWWLTNRARAAARRASSDSRHASRRRAHVATAIRLLPVIAFPLAPASTAAEPQLWPTKRITAVVPFGAGSITDVVPRVVFEQLSKQLGQTIATVRLGDRCFRSTFTNGHRGQQVPGRDGPQATKRISSECAPHKVVSSQ